jgi:dihydrofolate reductase
MEQMSAPTAQAVREFAAETPKRLWVFGGATVVTAAFLGGAVDVLDITIVPEAIGAGIPLFTEAFRAPMTVAHVVPYPSGAVRLVYDLVGA